VVSFTPRLFYLPEKKIPGTHWIGDWVGLKADLDDMKK
jgi:hypothetical protein